MGLDGIESESQQERLTCGVDLRVNVGVSDMSFDFIMPAGVQVVRPTGKEMGF